MSDELSIGEELELELETHIDAILSTLDRAGELGVELDPLAAIVGRLRARGESLNLEEAPPLMRMLLGGMLE